MPAFCDGSRRRKTIYSNFARQCRCLVCLLIASRNSASLSSFEPTSLLARITSWQREPLAATIRLSVITVTMASSFAIPDIIRQIEES